jgi:hypothetical protein
VRDGWLFLPLAAVVLFTAGCGGNERSGATTQVPPFVGDWDGHLRTLVIRSNEIAGEQIWTDCCSGNVVLYMQFRLTDRQGTAQAAVARATVTHVVILNRRWFTKAHPAPYVGERGTIRLRKKAIYEGLTGVYYCSPGTWPRPRLCRASFPRPGPR